MLGVTQPMPRALVVRPGWNVAARTDTEVLHAAVYYEFKTHAEGLLQRGLASQAVRLWSSVCQIDHFPSHLIGLGVEGFRLFRRAPSMVENCRRCAEFLGGFKFHGLAHGTAQLCWLYPGVTRGLRGNPTMIALARRSWICCSLSRCVRSGLPWTLRRTISMAWSPSSSTMETAWWISPSCGKHGELGRCHVEDGGNPSMVPIPADVVAWRAPPARAVRSLWGWLGALGQGRNPCRPGMRLAYIGSLQPLLLLPVQHLSNRCGSGFGCRNGVPLRGLCGPGGWRGSFGRHRHGKGGDYSSGAVEGSVGISG